MALSFVLLFDQSEKEVFDAVNNVRAWWSEELEGSSGKLGDVFTYRYRDMHKSTQTITEFVPNKKVVWHVSDATLTFVKSRGEWNGTDIVFEIGKKGGKTELRFTHVGLVPSFECYEACSDGWGYYIKESLQSLITTGKAKPNPED